MSNSDVTFAVFDALLREVGFTKVEQPDAVFRYVHEKSDTVVLVRIRDMQAPVPWGTFASTRKILDGRGVLSCADFDQRVRQLEQTLGKPVATANGAPQAAERGGRSRTRRRSVVTDEQE
jgi:hypothetical protein